MYIHLEIRYRISLSYTHIRICGFHSIPFQLHPHSLHPNMKCVFPLHSSTLSLFIAHSKLPFCIQPWPVSVEFGLLHCCLIRPFPIPERVFVILHSLLWNSDCCCSSPPNMWISSSKTRQSQTNHADNKIGQTLRKKRKSCWEILTDTDRLHSFMLLADKAVLPRFSRSFGI